MVSDVQVNDSNFDTVKGYSELSSGFHPFLQKKDSVQQRFKGRFQEAHKMNALSMGFVC
jgi:hypothetical protein